MSVGDIDCELPLNAVEIYRGVDRESVSSSERMQAELRFLLSVLLRDGVCVCGVPINSREGNGERSELAMRVKKYVDAERLKRFLSSRFIDRRLCMFFIYISFFISSAIENCVLTFELYTLMYSLDCGYPFSSSPT